MPISSRNAEFFLDLDAYKLLTRSSLYDLGGVRTRVFAEQADLNRKSHMFGVKGGHTFFIPVDDAFDVSVQLSGYDYERTRLKDQYSAGAGTSTQVINSLYFIQFIKRNIT